MLKRILLIILLLISYSVMNLSKGLDAKLFSTPEKKNVLPKPEEYYGYERAIEDSGIFSANKKNGEGINIGVLDGGIPDSFEPFVSGKYYCYGNKKSDHAREVGAILGGKKGIANGATLYFTSYEDFENYDNCLKWLIVEKKCNIINISRNIGPGSGAYDDFCELTDYYSKNYNVLFVCSNGNNDISLSTNFYCVDRYGIYTKTEGICGLRFTVNGPATGNYNKGRICLDDIVFSTEYASRGFISSFYEPIGAY